MSRSPAAGGVHSTRATLPPVCVTVSAKELKPTLTIVPWLNSMHLLRGCLTNDMPCQANGLRIAVGEYHAGASQRLGLRCKALRIALRSADVADADEGTPVTFRDFARGDQRGGKFSGRVGIGAKAEDDIEQQHGHLGILDFLSDAFD